jgi:hypothetical protein
MHKHQSHAHNISWTSLTYGEHDRLIALLIQIKNVKDTAHSEETLEPH